MPKTVIIGKSSLAEKISLQLKKQRLNLPKNQIEMVISTFLEETKKSLVKGEEIRLQGYFTLKTTLQKPRVAMNLQTGKKMNIPAKRIPKVKFSVDLKEEIAKRK